jgi:hypothetical protein
VRRFSPATVAVLVTALCFAYGRHPWSWAAGPIAGLFVWALDRKAHDPAEPQPHQPAPVD